MDDTKQASKLNPSTTTDERTICNGNVVLFKRNNSQRWQARIRRNAGEWVVYSTKQKDIEEAIKVADEKFRDIKYAQSHNKIDVTRKFSSVCKFCRKELLEEAKRTERELPKNLVQVIDKYIEPILGAYMCHNIDTTLLQHYSDKRAEIIGHQPTTSTVATHNTALNYLFRKAKEKNFITFIPKTINDGVIGKRRPYFNVAEMRSLNANMHHFVNKAKKLNNGKGRNGLDTISDKSYWMREMIRDMALILVNTGMRTGKEILNLKWKNLSVAKERGKESILFSVPQSKTKQRMVSGYEPSVDKETGKKYGCWEPLKRIQSRFPHLKNLSLKELFNVDEYIFRYPNGERVIQEQMTKTFKKLLKSIKYEGREDGLLKDKHGEVRTLYSLRHTYASRRRYEGYSFDDLSVQMGTSVKMLEQHYSHFTVSDNPNKFAGHDKRSEQKRKKEQDESSAAIKLMAEQNSEQAKQIAELMKQNNELMQKVIDKNTKF